MTSPSAVIQGDLTVAKAVAAYNANPAGGPYIVVDNAANLLAGLTQLQALQSAGALASVTMVGAATLTAARAQALFGLPGFALASGATLALADSAINLATLAPAVLAAASSVTLTGGGAIAAAQAQTFSTLAHLTVAKNAQFSVADSAANVLSTANAAGIALARSVVVTGANTVSAQQALQLWALPLLRLSTGATLVVADTAAGVLAAFQTSSMALHPFTSIALTGANTLTVANLRALIALGPVTLGNGATLTVSDLAGTIVANLYKLETLATSGLVGAITLLDPGTPLVIPYAAYVADAAALALISGKHTLTVLGATAAQAAALQTAKQAAGFAVVDSTAAVQGAIDALNADTRLTGITLTDGSTATLSLDYAQYAAAKIHGSYRLAVSQASVAQASGLQGNGHIVTFSVSDSAKNIARALDTLATLTKLSGITLTDPGTPTLAITYQQYFADAATLRLIGQAFNLVVSAAPVSALAALQADPRVTAFAVADSAADILAGSAALGESSKLTGFTLTGPSTPLFGMTPAQYANLVTVATFQSSFYVAITGATASQALALAGASRVHSVVISDTAANVVTAFNALAHDYAITGITLTDVGTATLAITGQQYLLGRGLLGKIGTPYTLYVTGAAAYQAPQLLSDGHVTQFSVTDNAANVAAFLDQINGGHKASGITLTGGGTPTLAITFAQYSNDTIALGLLQGSYTLTVSGVPAANAAAVQADSRVSGFAVADTAANILVNLDALNGDTLLTGITATDPGTPTVYLTGAQYAHYAADTFAAGLITSAYNVVVNGATVSQAAVLGANSHVTGFTVTDSAANVAAALDALNGDSLLSEINLTDTGTPTISLSYAQYLADGEALAKIYQPIAYVLSGVPTSAVINLQYDRRIAGFTISDSAANVNAALDTLGSYANLTAITLTDVDPQLQLTGDQVINDLAALKKITNAVTLTVTDTPAFEVQEIASLVSANSFAPGTSLYVSVVDSSSSILTSFQSLADYANGSGAFNLESISLINPGATPMVINIAQYSNYLAAIKLLQNDNVLTVSNATVQMAGAVQSDHTVGAFAIVDTGANVAAAIDALNSDTKLTKITLTDTDTPTLAISYAQYIADTTALGLITDDNTQRRFTLTVSGVPAADAATVQADSRVSGFAVVDTAQNILNNFDTLNQDTLLTAITATDPSTPVLDITGAQYADYAADTFAAGLIPEGFELAVSDASASLAAALAADGRVISFSVTDSAANVFAALDTLESARQLTDITLNDSGVPAVTLTYEQYTADQRALDLISSNYHINLTNVTVSEIAHGFSVRQNTTITISDNAANVVQYLDELQADPNIVQIGLTDAATPTLAITYAQYIADQGILAGIVTPCYLTVTDAPVTDLSALQDDTRVSGFTISDSAANLSTAFDTLGAASTLTSITVADGSQLQLTGDQTAAYFGTLSKITGPFDLNVSNATVAEEQQLAAFARAHPHDSITVSVSDTAANISAGFATLGQDTLYDNPLSPLYSISSLTVTDGNTNRLVVSLADLDNYDALISVLTNDTVLTVTEVYVSEASGVQADPHIGAFAVKGAATDIAAGIDALNGDSKLTGITFYDFGTPTLAITYRQYTTDTFALGLITGSYTLSIASAPVAQATALAANSQVSGFSILDTAANVAAAFDALNGTAKLTGITVSDGGTLAITYRQYTTDTTTLGFLAGSYSLAVSGVAVANAAALLANSHVTGFTIVDSAANVFAALDLLSGDIALKAITLTDSGTPTFTITGQQYAHDATVLGLISGNYALTVTGATVAQAASLAGNSHVTSFTIADTSANVNAAFDALNNDVSPAIIGNNASVGLTAITLTDPGTPVMTLTAQQFLNDQFAQDAIVGNFQLVLTGLSVAQAQQYANSFDVNSITISDTTANIFNNLALIGSLHYITAITLADPGTPAPPIEYGQYTSGTATFNLISTPYTLSVSDVPVADAAAVQRDSRVAGFTISDSSANVFAALDALNGDSTLTGISLLDPYATVQMSYQQFAADQIALGKIHSAYNLELSGVTVAQVQALQGTPHLAQIAISDTAANVSAALDSLTNSAGFISGITLTDGGTPTLTLSYNQVVADAAAVNLISYPYTLDVTDVPAADAQSADFFSDLGSFSVVDTVANVAQYLDQLTNVNELSAITLTDGGDPQLTLSNAEYEAQLSAGSNSAISKIQSSYQLDDVAPEGAFTFAQTAGMIMDGTAGNVRINDRVLNVSIIGGPNDVIDFGPSSDFATVIVHAGFAIESIYNFNADKLGTDVLQFDKSVFADWAHVLGATTQVNGNLVITLDPSDVITLYGADFTNFNQSTVKLV